MRLKITVSSTYNGGRRKRKRDFKNRTDRLYQLQSVSCCTYTWYIFFSFLFFTFLFYFHFLLCKSTQIDWSLLSVRSNVALSSVRWNFIRDQLLLNSVKKKRVIWKKKERNKEVRRSIFTKYGIRIRRSEKKNEISGLYNFCWFSDLNVTLWLRRIT